SHAIESYVTTRRNPLSQMFAREAWRLLEANFEIVLRQPGSIEARGAMQLGAHYAGVSIENSMLGVAHSCANPLTAHYGLTHGIAVGVMLPNVVRFNAVIAADTYARLTGDAQGVADRVDNWLRAAQLPTPLDTLAVSQSILPLL